MTQSPTFGAVPAGRGLTVREDLNLSDEAAATEHEGAFAPDPAYPFMRWRHHAAGLLRRRNASNDGWEILENDAATADPTVNDDAADGYIRGARWINVAAGRIFFLTDPTTGAAVWVQAGGSGGGSLTSVFGRTGAIGAQAGDYTADQISDGGGKVMMTAAERTTLAEVSFPTKVIPLKGTASSADTANIRAAIAAIKAAGQPGELLMSGDFMIGHAGDTSGIDPDSCAFLKLTGRGYCRWFKGVAATTAGVPRAQDPGDGTAYPLLARTVDDGPGKVLIISNMIFEGDLATTMTQLGDASRLTWLRYYDRVELRDVEARWASQMGLTFGDCNQVRGSRLHLHRIARDGLNASNCADVAVTNSDFAFIIDDCCAANLSAVNVADRGQQRAFVFTGNRVSGAQGVKVLGGKHILIANNSIHVPLNYGVYIGSDASYAEGGRPIEDVMVLGNTITDLVGAALYDNPYTVDTAILISQSLATPRNVIVRGNTLAQRTAGTDGESWSSLKLRGIHGENRLWHLDAVTGAISWANPTLTGEAFLGQGKAVRIEAPNGLDRITYDVDDNRYDGFSGDAFLRSQFAWDIPQTWAMPSTATESSAGAAARITGLDLRGYLEMRLTVEIGAAGGGNGASLRWFYSLDGGASWADSGAAIILDGTGNQTLYGGWTPIPDALGQTFDAQLALFGQGGNGASAVTVNAFQLDVRGLDQQSAKRLLPRQVTASEKATPTATALRSFSPKDVADIASVAGGGTGSVIGFATVAVSGQGSVIADQAADTLTLAAGSGISLTTDAGTDTVTIAATATADAGDFAGKTAGVTLDIWDDAGTLTVDIANNGVGDNELRDAAATSVIGRAADTTGDPADIVAAADGQYLRRSGGALGFGPIVAGDLPAIATFATVAVSGQGSIIADQADDTLTLAAGNGISLTTDAGTDTVTIAATATADAGDFAGKTAGVTLDIWDDAGTLTVDIANNGVGDNELRDAAGTSVIGRSAGTAGDPADIVAAADGQYLRRSGGTLGFGPIVAGDLPLAAIPYDILCGITGTPAHGETVLLVVAPRPFRIPANAWGSRLQAGTAATGSSMFSVQKNGAPFLSITVAASATVASFASAQTDFATGDLLKIVAPATADATLADIAITLVATLL